MQKKTKIVATVGPSSQSVEVLSQMILAGVNVFRLNFSHGTHEYHEKILQNIRLSAQETGLIVSVLQDICGPKIRVRNLQEPFHLKSGDRVDFYYSDIEGEKIASSHYKLSINQNSILKMLKTDDEIYLCDGAIKARVSACEDNFISTIVQNGAILHSRKGVNFPNTRLGIDILTQKDRLDMAWGVKNGVDYMAISFVQNASDMIQARQIIDSLHGEVELIAKIEKFDAVENIDEILKHSDGIMVARGDLGIEVPFHEVPVIQKMLIAKANEHSKPVITATQMLLSMTEKESATRAEISDVANAVLDGTDAVMLSEESAVGHNPVLVVETMVQTIQSIEKIYKFDKFLEFKYFDDMDIINESAIRLGDALNASGIIAMTTSGNSIKKLSRYRPKMTIYAATHDKRVARLLTLMWGVVPAFVTDKSGIDDMLRKIISSGVSRGIIDEGEIYIFTAGDPVGVKGTTNLIRILKRHEIEFFSV